MERKSNKRLQEVRLGIYLNHIDKTKDKMRFSKLLKVLGCVASSINGEARNTLSEITQISVCNGFARATDKELVATLKTFFTKNDACKRMKINYRTYEKRYNMDDESIDDEYIESLTPIFDDSTSTLTVSLLNAFISNFKLYPKRLNSNLENSNRTLEIEFMLVYDSLMGIFESAGFVDKFLINLCKVFNLDYGTISELKNNLHVISRSYPRFRYNEIYLMQEVLTLYTKRGYTKNFIVNKLLGKPSSYIYTRAGKQYLKTIDEEDLPWQYIPTVNWEHLDKTSVERLLNILYDFSEYEV